MICGHDPLDIVGGTLLLTVHAVHMTQGLHQAFAVLPKVEITDILEPTVPFQLLK